MEQDNHLCVQCLMALLAHVKDPTKLKRSLILLFQAGLSLLIRSCGTSHFNKYNYYYKEEGIDIKLVRWSHVPRRNISLVNNILKAAGLPEAKVGTITVRIVACQAHPALVKQVSYWPVFFFNF